MFSGRVAGLLAVAQIDRANDRMRSGIRFERPKERVPVEREREVALPVGRADITAMFAGEETVLVLRERADGTEVFDIVTRGEAKQQRLWLVPPDMAMAWIPNREAVAVAD